MILYVAGLGLQSILGSSKRFIGRKDAEAWNHCTKSQILKVQKIECVEL
jgi:hypothetical protein